MIKKKFLKKLFLTIFLSLLVVFIIFAVVFLSGVFKTCDGCSSISNGRHLSYLEPSANNPLILDASYLTFSAKSDEIHVIRAGIFNRHNRDIFLNLHLDSCITASEVPSSFSCYDGRLLELGSRSVPSFIGVNETVGFNLQVDLTCDGEFLPVGMYTCMLLAYECEDVSVCDYSNETVLERVQFAFKIE